MELQTIQTMTTWNDAAGRINSNNLKIITEVTKLQSATYKNKGYFGSIYALQEAYPTASPGSKAYVGRTYPYTIYIWENNSWIDSGATGGEESVDLSDYYTKEEFEQKVADYIPEIIDDTWWIDGKNTGLPARGEKGDQGPVGPQGPQGASNTHNIGSIDLFEQIIAQKQNQDLTLEDKEAILNGKVITTSVGNGTVPTISITSIEGLGLMLMFHFNERLYSMCVMWNNDRCYINGVFSFTQATKLFADSELSETSENSVQNKVVTEKLTELSAKVATLEAQVKELMEKADTTAILGKAKLGYAVLS